MARFNGIYAGICVSDQDPSGRSRLQVKVPVVLGEQLSWARGCVLPTSAGRVVLPSAGDAIWVMFEAGDAARPVWLPFRHSVPATVNSFGVYAGICVSNQDPSGRSRIQVKVPAVANEMTAWAKNVSGTRSVPDVGDTVWIVYEGGDPLYPVWLGVEP